MVADSGESILATIAGFIAPVFAPVGLGDWRIVTSLIAGFLAKESIVSMLSVLYGSVANLTRALSTVDALALLVFCLLYTPCVAAVAAVKRERGWKFAFATVVFQCVVAWIFAFLVHLIGSLFI
jgi:ferrous iron transport protein B